MKTTSKLKQYCLIPFGFGGNNAAVVIGKAKKNSADIMQIERKPLRVLGTACVTHAGNLNETIEAIKQSGKCSGKVDIDRASEILPKNKIRRLKRLPRITLSLAEQAFKAGGEKKPSSIYFGTGWGALSETYEFLDKLFESGEQFPSPTDFIGSVHNAPAGQAAIWYGAEGANITATGGDYSFEQALFSASLLSHKNSEHFMLISADEYHDVLSPVLDRSVINALPSDGGAAFMLHSSNADSGLQIFPSFFEFSHNNSNIIKSLAGQLGGPERIHEKFAVVFAGIPASERETAEEQLNELQSLIVQKMPVIDYRAFTGEFASASAVGCAIAVNCAQNGLVPAIGNSPEIALGKKGILLLGLGRFVTAVEIFPA